MERINNNIYSLATLAGRKRRRLLRFRVADHGFAEPGRRRIDSSSSRQSR